ncbi:MAG: 16S rRNA (cytosine(1402)-N(4))-methyltransferase RsmH [Lachnospiraceae bacterium]|nr:16S rRNA (cytosine(1402)-N(4))-methyltransferase RsmH [Lachnospiraceae bacterium]
MIEFEHVPVLFHETVDSLKVCKDGIYVDGTLGGAGHASLVCSRLDGGRFIGIDQDIEAIESAAKRLEPFKDKVTIVKSNYENMCRVLDDLGIDKVNGIMLDLGVSSHQLDDADRGFSYRYDAPLDMRMDRDASLSAYDIVNTYSKEEILKIIRDYGEEKFAGLIAANICKEREKKPIKTTFELLEIIRKSMPVKAQIASGHPGKRTFQAIRIACNRELEVLENSIEGMIDRLLPGGRLSIITFHSLEDRIVKNAFKTAENPCICPPNFPVCMCGRKPKGFVVTRKPILPSKEEEETNPRSKSAKLRVFERT